MVVIGIDPGPVSSAWARVGDDPTAPVRGGILTNEWMLAKLSEPGSPLHSAGLNGPVQYVAIEMISSYGMPVGKSVFETCVWIGRFQQVIETWLHCAPVVLMLRGEVKMHLCQSMRAKDSNIRAAIIDLYGGDKYTAIGLKATPGPLYGFKADMWAALGVALTYQAKLRRENVDGTATSTSR